MERHQNARICAGDDRTLSVTVSNPTGISVAGIQARYSLARTPANEPVVEKSSGAELVVTSVPPNINLAIMLRNDDTALLKPGDYYHEATVILASGPIVTVMTGTLRIDPSIIASAL